MKIQHRTCVHHGPHRTFLSGQRAVFDRLDLAKRRLPSLMGILANGRLAKVSSNEYVILCFPDASPSIVRYRVIFIFKNAPATSNPRPHHTTPDSPPSSSYKCSATLQRVPEMTLDHVGGGDSSMRWEGWRYEVEDAGGDDVDGRGGEFDGRRRIFGQPVRARPKGRRVRNVRTEKNNDRSTYGGCPTIRVIQILIERVTVYLNGDDFLRRRMRDAERFLEVFECTFAILVWVPEHSANEGTPTRTRPCLCSPPCPRPPRHPRLLQHCLLPPQMTRSMHRRRLMRLLQQLGPVQRSLGNQRVVPVYLKHPRPLQCSNDQRDRHELRPALRDRVFVHRKALRINRT